MDAYELARFNPYWFAALLCPVLLMGAAAAVARSRIVFWVITGLSLYGTFRLSFLSVVEKWDVRLERALAAGDEAGINRVANGDGANLAFMYVVGSPLEALIATATWFVFWRCVLGWWKKFQENKDSLPKGQMVGPPAV